MFRYKANREANALSNKFQCTIRYKIRLLAATLDLHIRHLKDAPETYGLSKLDVLVKRCPQLQDLESFGHIDSQLRRREQRLLKGSRRLRFFVEGTSDQSWTQSSGLGMSEFSSDFKRLRALKIAHLPFHALCPGPESDDDDTWEDSPNMF